MNRYNLGEQPAKMTKQEKWQMWGALGFFLFLATLCLVLTKAARDLDAELAASLPSANPPPPLITELQIQTFQWIAGIVVAIYIIWQILKSEKGFVVGLVALAVLVIGAIFWILLYRGADVTTAEARDENLQVIRVIQPIGEPETDEAYSTINENNAKTNITNAGGTAIYAAILWVTVIVFSAIGIIIYYMSKR